MTDPFDPGGLALPASGPPRRPPRHRPGEKFLRGPIPWRWVEAAAALPGKALAVGLAVWFEAGCARDRSVRLTLAKAGRLGVPASTARRGLRALAAAGLVTLTHRPGRGLDVTLTDPPSAR